LIKFQIQDYILFIRKGVSLLNRQQRRQYYRKNKWARTAKKSVLDKMMEDYAVAAQQRWTESAEKN
jgi:hypothetical protein